MKEKTVLVKLSVERLKSFVKYNSFKPKIEIAPRTGIDIKNDILAASILSKLNNLAPVIVIPDLLTPGINASVWKNPIINAFLKVKLLFKFLDNLNLSLKNRRTPKIIVIHPIIFIFLRLSIKFNSTKKKPVIITGIDDKIILKNKFLFFTKFIISLWKKVITAKKDPMCKLTSTIRLWLSKFKNFEKIIRCEDELTGMNSVIPWTKDRINTSTILNP